MAETELLAVATAAVIAALASACLPPAARALGWTDAGDGGRKAQRSPIALSGGAAIFAGLLGGAAVAAATGDPDGGLGLGRDLGTWLGSALGFEARLSPIAGLVAAFAVGLADDLTERGLSPVAKLTGQLAAGAALCAPIWLGGAPLLEAVAVTAAAMVAVAIALNALNTFDNADGAASGLAAAALAIPAPLAAAPVLAFLPFNLWGRAEGRKSILGDAGSHVLGMLIVLTPAAWPALALPLADLVRLAALRPRLGQKPWVGDRRHLAHRLLDRGLSPRFTALVLAGIAAPSIALGPALSGPGPAALPVAAGIATTALLATLALLWAPMPARDALELRSLRRVGPEPGP